MGAEIDRFPARVVPALRARDAGDSYTSTVAGLRFVLTLLSKADQELKSSGVISADTLKRLEKYLGAELVKDITPLNHGLWNSRGQTDDAAMKIREETVNTISYLLTKVREPLATEHAVLARSQYVKRHIGSLVGSIPNAHDLDRILRYETNIHRQLEAAITNLERSQWRRRGDFVPPPLKVSIGD